MIGYYVHHRGQGHAHRALAFARAWTVDGAEKITGLSTLPQPVGWPGSWVQLAPDDVGSSKAATAGGVLHWAPLGNSGLCQRMSTIAGWIGTAAPSVMVVDVSVEVQFLARLHGVPVVTMVLPGRRDDVAHVAGMRLSEALVCAWPPEAEEHTSLTPGLPKDVRRRLRRVGGISRLIRPVETPRHEGTPRRAVVLQGRGGDALTTSTATELARDVPGWRWTVLGGGQEWREDPSELLADADVVITQAGQGSVAAVAPLRRPAVLVAGQRPHEEQTTTASVLTQSRWPVIVCESAVEAFSSHTLDLAARLDGEEWASWCDGAGADRMAAIVRSVALTRPADAPQPTGTGS